MKLGRLNHVGIATPSIEASVALYRDLLGATGVHAPFDLPGGRRNLERDSSPLKPSVMGGTQPSANGGITATAGLRPTGVLCVER